MIFHPRIRKISKYIDGTLENKERDKIEIHLSKCESCRKNVQFLKKASSLVRIPKGKVESISDKVMGSIKPQVWDTSVPIIGEVQSVTGAVTLFTKGQDNGVKAFPGLALRKGDTLNTNGEGRALVKLNDGSFLYVNKETTLDFETSKFNLALKIGEIFAMMKPQPKRFTILTPSARLAVIGTEFDTKVTRDKQTILQVLKGKVSFRNKFGNTVVGKKQQVEATRDTKPVPIKIKDTRTVSNWTGIISTKKKSEDNKMKKIHLIIIALLLLIGITAVGYWIYNRYFTYELPPYEATESTSTSVSQSKPVSEQSAGIQKSAPTSYVLGNDTLVYRPDMRIGERAVIQIDQTNKTIFNIPNNPRPMENRQNFSMKIAIATIEKQPDDIYVTEFEILSAAMVSESPQGKFVVSSDSASPQDPKAIALWNMVKAMSGSKFIIYINKDWMIVKIDGIDDMLNKVKATCSPEIVASMQGSFNKDAMGNMMNMYGQVLPENPVKVGDKWKYASKQSIPMLGNMETKIDYKFVQWEELMGRQCMVIEMSGSISSKGSSGQSIIPKLSIRDGHLSGKLWYDPVTGDTIESSINQNLNIEMVQKIRDRQGFREQKMTGQVTNYVASRLISSEKIK